MHNVYFRLSNTRKPFRKTRNLSKFKNKGFRDFPENSNFEKRSKVWTCLKINPYKKLFIHETSANSIFYEIFFKKIACMQSSAVI